MGAGSVVVLLVALGGAREPSTRAMAAATQEALEPTALVLVREVPDATLASDDRAVAIADTVHADAVAVLTWPDAEHHRAHVHVLAARSGRWIDRDIDFRNVDAAEDRGKALGFAVASMVPEHREPPREPVAAPPPPPPPPPRAAPPVEAPRPPPEPPRARRFAFDLLAVASTGIDGYAGGFGSAGSVRYRFARALSVRLGGGLRIGDVPPAGASSYVATFDAGLAWTPLVTGPVAFGLRADGVLLLQTVTRPTLTDATSRGSLFLGGGDALLEGSWTFIPEAALVVAGGAEVAAGATTVVVDGLPVATIPRGRVVGEFGLRVLF